MNAMKSVLVLEPVPTEIEALIERRQALGQDRFDEVWEGVYHMTPGPSNTHAFVESEVAAAVRPHAMAAGFFPSGQFNLGEPDDYRVPDGGYHRQRLAGVRVPTAAIVVEVLSPGDETYDKFGFYAAHGVEEIFVADPATRSFEIWRRTGPDALTYSQTGTSDLLGVSATDIARSIDWPNDA